ncbi:YBR220C [Zygosaccharomyces parabailii]|nr:YBR220C [Zygosaccharomyces parabailii]CDH10121.1 probable Similarity to human acetyl-coenzyme A transporter [Zygosaccharomyces bailii ISA1307]
MGKKNLAKKDLPQFYLLVVLYLLQGIPVGLAFGTVPFLLKSMAKETSFTTLGIFSIATYPYSLKILWSPIVDSIYNPKVGRRRTWIIPVQLLSGTMLLLLGCAVSRNLVFKGVDDAFHGRQSQGIHSLNILTLAWYFGFLVFLCATQDIAVDGWALTILSKDSLSYASTAQTVGMNLGYFLSFTVFISLNSSDFANKYFRTVPKEYGFVSLGGYMKFAGTLYILVTIYVILCTKERPLDHILPQAGPSVTKKDDESKSMVEYGDGDVIGTTNTANIKYVYKCFGKILKLRSVQSLAFIHLTSKLAFQCNEAATNLKLLEKGFKKEDLAVTVLIDVPFEVIFGYYVAKWSSESSHHHNHPSHRQVLTGINKWVKFLVGEPGILTPWLWGFLGRLSAAALGSYVLKIFPQDAKISRTYFLIVVFQHLLGSFMSTVQFVGISAFHTRVADPVVGGTYMTLLNTLSNFGGTWPRMIIMSMINYFTVYECYIPNTNQVITYQGGSMEKCTDGWKGEASILRDGYYVTNGICLIIGTLLYFGYLKRKAQQLQTIPVDAWRCS